MRCPECDRKVSRNARECPACGEPLKARPISVGWIAFWVIFGLGTITVILCCVGLFSGMGELAKQNAQKQAQAEKELVFKPGSASTEVGPFGGIECRGTIVNNSPNPKQLVIVRLYIYDASGAQIGTAMDSIQDLAPWGHWNFRAISNLPGAASWKLAKISGK